MPMQKSTKHGIATFFKIINIVTFAIVSLIWKLKLDNISVEQQYFLQAFAATVTLFVIIILFPVNGKGSRFKRTKAKFKVHSLKSYFLRATVSAIATPALMQALKLTGANEVMTITQLSPVFTTILAVIFLKEKIRINCIIALFLGLCGVIVMIYGGGFKGPLEISPNYVSGILLAVIAAISWSVYNIICKKQTDVNDDHFTQAFYCFAIATVMVTPFAYAKWKTISFDETMWALGSGVIGVLSVVALFLSYKFSSVIRMSPHSYLRIIVSAVTMYILKDIIPSTQVMLAILFILIGNFCVVFESTFYNWIQLCKKPEQAPQVSS